MNERIELVLGLHKIIKKSINNFTALTVNDVLVLILCMNQNDNSALNLLKTPFYTIYSRYVLLSQI